MTGVCTNNLLPVNEVVSLWQILVKLTWGSQIQKWIQGGPNPSSQTASVFYPLIIKLLVDYVELV